MSQPPPAEMPAATAAEGSAVVSGPSTPLPAIKIKKPYASSGIMGVDPSLILTEPRKRRRDDATPPVYAPAPTRAHPKTAKHIEEAHPGIEDTPEWVKEKGEELLDAIKAEREPGTSVSLSIFPHSASQYEVVRRLADGRSTPLSLLVFALVLTSPSLLPIHPAAGTMLSTFSSSQIVISTQTITTLSKHPSALRTLRSVRFFLYRTRRGSSGLNTLSFCLYLHQTRLKTGEYNKLGTVQREIEHCFWNAKKCTSWSAPSLEILPLADASRVLCLPMRLPKDNQKSSAIFEAARILHVSLLPVMRRCFGAEGEGG